MRGKCKEILIIVIGSHPQIVACIILSQEETELRSTEVTRGGGQQTVQERGQTRPPYTWSLSEENNKICNTIKSP